MARRAIPFALRLLALACTAGAIALVVSAQPARSGSPAGSTGPALATPVWSPRRVPGLFVADAARAVFERRLAPVIAPYNGCVAVDGPDGPVARVHADTALAPASTLKLVTATSALAHFGAAHRFTTRVVADATNLVVIGGGDPVLATDDYVGHEHAQPARRAAQYTSLARLADAIVAAGVRDVGAIFVDDQAQDAQRFLPDWKPSYLRQGEIGALGALTVNGGFGDPVRQIPAADPAIETGTRLAALLAARHVRVARGVQRGTAPAAAHEIAHVDSPPLGTIVGDMLRGSDNYIAEELLRDAGGGTTRQGIATTLQTLRSLNIPTAGAVLHDGSGLAPDDRVSCTTLLAVLELSSQPRFAAIDAGLAVAGQSGTLAIRFVGDPLAGRLRAKTGSIDGVVGLVGVIAGPAPMRFAFLANGGFSTVGGQQLQSEIAHAVAAPGPAPTAGQLVPMP